MLNNPFKAYTLLRRTGSVLRRFTSKTTIVRQYAERFGNPRRRSSGKRTQNAAWNPDTVCLQLVFIMEVKSLCCAGLVPQRP